MLLSLHVKNLALIDETEVFFEPGLNILTGETGAGKSVLIGSINLALGAKAEKEMIRTGAEYALVELLFQSEDASVTNKMAELEIPVEDGQICISRRIQPGRSVCRINGETVNTKQVKELAELLIDIHGQHEHQSLLHKRKHQEILDAYSGEELSTIKDNLKNCYQEYQSVLKELENSSMDEDEKRRTIALAEFEVNEITEAKLVPGEDEVFEQDYRKLSNVKKIGEAMAACTYLSGYDSEGAGALIGRALRELRGVENFDSKLEEMSEQLAEIDNLINDFNRSASNYMDDLEIDPSDFVRIEERLNKLNHLKGKYGQTIEAVLEYGQKQQAVLEKMADYDAYVEELKRKSDTLYQELLGYCEQASLVRKMKASILADKMQEALEELSFLAVDFAINIDKKESPGIEGYDDIEFLISTNPGESRKPLSQVASGGELSRIMLAIKTVLADKDSVDTLIFDEIDAGISGRTAWQVSRQLGRLSGAHQVLSITHLPQIAAMADTHFLIEKTSDGMRTVTDIVKMDEEDSVKEVARLLGSDIITETAIVNAYEMKKMAKETKHN